MHSYFQTVTHEGYLISLAILTLGHVNLDFVIVIVSIARLVKIPLYQTGHLHTFCDIFTPMVLILGFTAEFWG